MKTNSDLLTGRLICSLKCASCKTTLMDFEAVDYKQLQFWTLSISLIFFTWP